MTWPSRYWRRDLRRRANENYARAAELREMAKSPEVDMVSKLALLRRRDELIDEAARLEHEADERMRA